jgi:hypothetical protein
VRDEAGVVVVIVKRLTNLRERSFLLCAGGTLPIKAKAFAADRAEDVGGVTGWLA